MADMISVIFSGVALLVSIIIALYEAIKNKKYNDLNLEANLISDLLRESLIVKIPTARATMCFYGE